MRATTSSPLPARYHMLDPCTCPPCLLHADPGSCSLPNGESLLRIKALQDEVKAQTAQLAEWNQQYEKKFSHIFIICASGKSAEEMLAAMEEIQV